MSWFTFLLGWFVGSIAMFFVMESFYHDEKKDGKDMFDD